MNSMQYFVIEYMSMLVSYCVCYTEVWEKLHWHVLVQFVWEISW